MRKLSLPPEAKYYMRYPPAAGLFLEPTLVRRSVDALTPDDARFTASHLLLHYQREMLFGQPQADAARELSRRAKRLKIDNVVRSGVRRLYT